MAGDYEIPAFSDPRRLREKQPISVPFLWEEKPGTPKREWAMAKPTPWVIPPSPARLVVSVPFLWEEKPGKPLASPISDLDFAASNPSLDEIEYQALHESPSENGSGYYDDWYSLSETDGHGSSSGSATRNGSMDATTLELICPLPPPPAAGLEFICPLSPPSASFLDKVCRNREKLTSKENWREDCGLVTKRTLTLEELILLSRKLSYRRKTVNLKKKRSSMVFPLSQPYI